MSPTFGVIHGSAGVGLAVMVGVRVDVGEMVIVAEGIEMVVGEGVTLSDRVGLGAPNLVGSGEAHRPIGAEHAREISTREMLVAGIE